ncbi:MAG: [Fe-Fe] hydrogenase large subunit C-terminal domain-containing protein, partial [Chloroflexota bacterium]|nr:[Fe-Fe] hydrogenase large subunit C-terminal domain-containing protein [Chloroflexota bacterium]
KVCALNAKQVESDVVKVWQLSGEYPSVIAILSSSFPAAFPQVRPGQVVAALKKLGFSEVTEVAFGAELVGRAYHRMLRENSSQGLIFTSCPAVVQYVEKYYPQLIDQLAPVVSPMVAMGRAIKEHYAPGAKAVFIGPCIAKKGEAQDDTVAGAIDGVLTFAELDEMLAAQGIDLAAQEEEQPSGPKPYMGRMYAVPGGWLRAADLSTDIMKNEVVAAEGKEQVVKIVQELAQGNIKARFLELLFCQGCINGPFIPHDSSFFKRREALINYTLDEADPAQTEKDLAQYAGLDLSRKFTARHTVLPIPNEEEITGMLARINKAKPGDELNCGACGYHTCRELATRVSQGLAEVEM